ncbi:MAG: endopeptidase La [Chloroflexota bacterium]
MMDSLEGKKLDSGEQEPALVKPVVTVQTGEGSAREPQADQDGDRPVPEVLSVLPLRNLVPFPTVASPLTVGRPASVRLVNDALAEQRLIGLAALRDTEVEEPSADDIYRVGVVAVVHQLRRAPDGTLLIFVQGLQRIRFVEFIQTEPYLRARVEPLPEQVDDSPEMEALVRNAVDLFRNLVELLPHVPEDVAMAALSLDDPRQLVYQIVATLRISIEDAQEILEMDDVKNKLRKLIGILSRELEVVQLGQKIKTDAQSEMEKVQREYFLREQLKAIKRELGEVDEQQVELEEYRAKIATANMPEEAEKEALRELSRMEKMPAAAAEYSVIKTYLDWMTSLPWSSSTPDNLGIDHARQVLDEDHYDLEEIKERILEYLAVRKLRLEREGEEEARRFRGAILCFVGPPGTGKTSLGQSIARALGRNFTRMALGGMRDEAEVRGHRRTYIGAMPGRIIQAIKRAGANNPVFMLDEIDKVGADWRGDPSSALLEVLDPQQNFEFRDHYLDVAFDLSKVMFITTANMLDPVPPPLRDRMEIIRLDGYTEEEKLKIAQQYLIPRQMHEASLQASELVFEEQAIRRMARDYTREAGVRNLEREIGSVCRKVATRVAAGGSESITVTADNVPDFLGKPRFYTESIERTEVPGVVTGLVWTPVGGDIIFIESTKMKGKGGMRLTGKLGEVMRESAQAAMSYVRAQAEALGIDEQVFNRADVHIHVPAGAVPKDGPSAGVTIATSLVSLFTDRCVRPEVGMTGEITLRGQVLPIGGLKQKLLAAHRSGLKTVIVPRRNEKDLDDIPLDIRQELNIVLVDRVEQVFEAALMDRAGAAEIVAPNGGGEEVSEPG